MPREMGSFTPPSQTADPSSPTEGQVWYRSDLDRLFIRDGVQTLQLVGKIKVLKTGTVAIGTTLTNIATVTLGVGSYKFHALHTVGAVGPPTGYTQTIGFSGTATGNFSVYAHAATGGISAGISGQATFGTALATISSVGPLVYLTEGAIIVTVAGDLTMGATRTGGTSATVAIGASLEAERWV